MYKQGAFKFQQRRHEDWNDNYRLYRDKVILNRLTQRQTVNIPLMKETIRTLLSKIDDAPDITFEDLGNDKQIENEVNEYWKYFYDSMNLEIKDVVDKKQIGLYGRSWKKLNIRNSMIYVEILDPMDVLIDEFVDPSDIETANYICHQHIYRTLSEVANNEYYDASAIQNLELFYATQAGLIKSQENAEALRARNQKMGDMGYVDVDNPLVGEVWVELNEHFIKLYDRETGEAIIYVVTTCGRETLMAKPLKEILGINFFPFESWADDVERTDFYSDGPGDIVRTPNILINSWFAQLSENRTLRNYNMKYYDSTDDDFVPQTYEPVPWGWYGVPGNPNDKIKDVQVSELTDSLNEINFAIGIVERATATTATEKGVATQNKITLGEIELINAKAMERITSMSKFYRISWKRFAEKWIALLEANADKLEEQELYKKNSKGDYIPRIVRPSKLVSPKGWRVIVTSSSEQEQKTLETLKKFEAIKAQMPDNKPLDKIFKKKMLGMVELRPDEEKEIMDYEEQHAENPLPGGPGVIMPDMAPAMAPVK